MKFVRCKECNDLFFLDWEPRKCACGKARGKYNEDGDTVKITESAELYGLSNVVFTKHKAETWLYPTHNGKVEIVRKLRCQTK